MAARSTAGPPSKRARRFAVVSGIVTFVNGLLQTLLGLGTLEPRTAWAPVHLTIGVIGLVVAPLCFYGLASNRPIFGRSRVGGDGERSFRMYERGLSFERPASLVPWSRVRSLEDLGDAFIVRTTLRRRYLPKRIFDDDGEAFWAFSASRMVSGGRMLVVPTNRRFLRNSAHP